MRKFLFSLFSFIAIAAGAQSIKMKIPSVTIAAGEDVIAYQFVDSLGVTVGSGGGGSVGRVRFDGIEIKKLSGPSAIELFKKSTNGTMFSDVTFEFYDAASVLYYRVIIREVSVTVFSQLSPECNGCSQLFNQVRFLPGKYELYDIKTGASYKWNVAQNQSYP